MGGSAEVFIDDDEMAMSDDDDDFVVQRRDVNAGRAVTSGPVLYSVAESVSQPRWGYVYVEHLARVFLLQFPAGVLSVTFACIDRYLYHDAPGGTD